MGLLISTFMKSQIAAIFGTAIITLIPATQFSGMIDPVASLEGLDVDRRGLPDQSFSDYRPDVLKALDPTDLWQLFYPVGYSAIPPVMGWHPAAENRRDDAPFTQYF